MRYFTSDPNSSRSLPGVKPHLSGWAFSSAPRVARCAPAPAKTAWETVESNHVVHDDR